MLLRLEVPHAPVRTSQEVIDSEQAKEIGLCIEDPNGPHGAFRTIRSPVSFDGERTTSVTAPPVLGADNAELVDPLRKVGAAAA